MKPITFSKASWHYKLINKMDNMPDENIPIDFCTYLKILISTVSTILILSIIGILLGPVAWTNTATWVVASLTTGQWRQPDSVFFYITLWEVSGIVIIVLLVLFRLIFSEVRKFLSRTKQKTLVDYTEQPSFVREIYRKFKSKTCVRITFD